MHDADIPQGVGQYKPRQTYIPTHPDQTCPGHTADTWEQQRIGMIKICQGPWH